MKEPFPRDTTLTLYGRFFLNQDGEAAALETLIAILTTPGFEADAARVCPPGSPTPRC